MRKTRMSETGEVQSMRQKHETKAWIALYAALLAVPLVFLRSPYYQDIVFLVYIKAILAVSWNITGGYAGVFSIGHSVYFGLGAYTVVLLSRRLGISPWIGTLAGACIALAASLTLGRVLLKLQSMFFTLATSASLLIFYHLAPYLRGLTGGWAGISLGRQPGFANMMFRSGVWYSLIGAVLLILAVVLSRRVRDSKVGYYFMALREDEMAASATGVNVQTYKIIALSISAVITAVVAGLATAHSRQVSPDFAFSADRSTEMFLFSIVGGIGTVAGPLLGTLVLGPLSEYLRVQLGGRITGLNQIIFGFVLIAVILWLPEGLVSIRGRKKRLRRSNADEGGFGGDSSGADAGPEHRDVKPITEERLRMAVEHIKADSKAGCSDGRPVLRVSGVSRRFGGLLALDDVDFEVSRGEVLGVIGPNGAGKSTLFNAINGFIRPDSGTVEFMGQEITGLPAHRVFAAGMGRVFQNLKPLQNMSALDNVIVGAYGRTGDPKKARGIAERALNKTGFDASRYGKLPGELNVFERKQVELARVLAGDPSLILVDEIMAGLKPEEMDWFVELFKCIAASGITLVVIEHRMRAVMQLCDRIVVLHHGAKLCEGVPADVVTDSVVVEAYLGKPLEVGV